jgi:A/G-specific adenine glycosylase
VTGDVARPLLTWFQAQRRTLPWRTDRSPYRVVVSEFMLQQTQVERVLLPFERFVAAFPSFAALAAAPRAGVVRAWQGLGYNSRAVRLHALARTVCKRHSGELPRETSALLALPGVGPYTASAIRAFAFDLDEIALDTNVRRVLHRAFFGLEWPAPRSNCEVADAGRRLLPGGRANELNSALMDLGATVCTARAPKCLLCPLANACAAAPVDPRRLTAAAQRGAAGRPKQRFEDTTRYLRGRIVDALRLLPARESISLLDLHRELLKHMPGRTLHEVSASSAALARDGVVAFDGRYLSLENDNLINL